MKRKFKKFVAYLLALAIIMPLWLVSGFLNAKPAMAATSVTGGGTVSDAIVNGTGLDFSLKPIVVISQNDGDINTVDDIKISISDATAVQLQFNSGGGIITTATGSVVVGLPSETVSLIDIPITTSSISGDVIVIEGIKIKSISTGVADAYLGNAQLQISLDSGATVFGLGDIINVDAQIPTIESVETEDLNTNGQLDAVKVTFSENIDDSTVSATDFVVGSYSNLAFASTTNGDFADNNYIYLTFDESGTVDTFATPDLSYSSTLTDLAGNLLLPVTITSINNTALAAPANLSATVGDGEVSLLWDAVFGADYYNVYYQKFSDSAYTGPIATTRTLAEITQLENGTLYRFIVRAVKIVGTNAIESTNAWLETTPVAKIVATSAFTATSTSASITIAPETAQAAETTVEPQQTVIEEQPADDGQIKGEESTTEEESSEKINWTPWVILFVLILLAGAATGGYFYWFAGDEEVQTIVKSKPKIDKKPTSESGKDKSSKKPRRW